MEGTRFRLEAVRHALAAALVRARKAHLRRHVENESEIRLEIADGDPFEGADETRIEMAERALIDSGRVDKAVADHPHALRQRGLDRVAHVIAAGSGEQQCLGLHPERLGHAREQYVSDDFGAGRAAGLACAHHADAGRRKAIRQQRRMGRLARAFAAFEGDESSTHRSDR